MSTRVLRATRGSFVGLSLLVFSVATASAETDKKETTKKTWAVDSSHGTYSDSIPIEVPAFRGITPELGLTYDSSSGNGELGVGWSLDGVGVVERASPGKGAPRYDASDIFLLDGKELVACAPGSASPSCTTGGTHSTKVESYERIALTGTGSDSRWTITAKDGIEAVYAPVFSLNGGADVYRWGLAQVKDTKGNVVTYGWDTSQLGWEHPASVTYNGTAVTFYYETRPDPESAAVGHGSMRTALGRLKTIDVTVSGSRLRAYELSYAQSGATSRSLLSSVQQFGRDATLDASGTVTGGTSLPAITMDYRPGSSSFLEGSEDFALNSSSSTQFFAIDINGDGMDDMLEVTNVCLVICERRRLTWISDGSSYVKASDEGGMSGSEAAQFLPMDVNADGMTDLVELYPNWAEMRRRVWLSNGSGFAEASNECCMKTTSSEDARYIALDVNGDGMSDMVELYPSAWLEPEGRRTWISTGTGFTEASVEAFDWDKEALYLPMDINGDGKSDLVELREWVFGTYRRQIWLSIGTGFSAGTVDYPEGRVAEQQKKGDVTKFVPFLPMDVNGDGKSDLVEFDPSWVGSRIRKTWLSTGDSFTLASQVTLPYYDAGDWFLALDVNGDGRSDVVSIVAIVAGLQERQIWLSVGDDFVAGASDTQAGFFDNTKIMAADVNGDGLSEMITLAPNPLGRSRLIWSMTGPYPDLLTSITNSLGGAISVSYTPSSAWDNTNNPPLMQTATAVTATDGRGGSATTYYQYSGGLQDRAEKRFLGFRDQVETLPCIEGESSCPQVETQFRQDYGAAGKPERVDHRAGGGELLRSEVYEYTTNGSAMPWTTLATGEWEYAYIGGGAACPGAECKRTYTSRTFNEYGEVAAAVDYGDYDADGDETTQTTTFVPNTTAYIVELPAETKTFEGANTDGALLDQTLSYYDGAASSDEAPSAGLPTTTARWLSDPSSFVETHKEYDAWGNVTADIDALGARTERTFDSTYHLLPTSQTNALAQATATSWDVVCGVPTQTTDLNGQPTTMTYDPLCRMTEKVAPGGMFERHSWVKLGDAGSQYELVETPGADGTENPLWTRSYFDGYRRGWRSVSQGPDAATGDIHVDTAYNARGEAAAVTAAYYRVSGEPQPATYATTSSYDALDRLIRVTHPDGNYTSKTYGLWSVTDTDELGHARADHFNADGKRVAHDELIGGAIQTTSYVYDTRGDLAQSTDPLGNVITYERDSLGRQTKLVDPDWGTWTYEYDAAGRLTAQTDAKGQRTLLGYDALGRKAAKTSLAGTGSAVTVSWTYDEVRDGYSNIGRLTTMTDSAGTETSDYDVAGNVVKTVRTIEGESYTSEHGFDQGNRKRWTTYPDGDALGTPSSPLAYDGAGRLASIPGYVDVAIYTADGNLAQLESANGSVTTKQHMPERGWLSGISTTSGKTTIQDLALSRDAIGKITAVTSPFESEGWTYDYDELDRLTAAESTSSSKYDQTLDYDAIGNITHNSRFGDYTYDKSRPHAVTAAGSNSYSYDAAGLMTSGAGRTLSWDGDNRLASITKGPSAAAAPSSNGPSGGCRAAGGRRLPTWGWLVLVPLVCTRRLRRRASAGALAALVLLVACAGDPSDPDGKASGNAPSGTDGARGTNPDAHGATTLTFTYDANGARIQQVEGAITRRHLGDGYEIEVGGGAIKYVSLAGAIVARKEGETKTWVHTDQLGSIQAETDASGAEVHRKTYRPYGEILSTEGTLAFEPHGYTGQRHDASDLVYLHARYYDPALGRFISPDTEIDGTDAIGLNRYAYVGNDPINHDDVDGTCADGRCPSGPRAKVGAAVRAVGRGLQNVAAAAGAGLLIGGAAVAPLAPATPQGVHGAAFSQPARALIGEAPTLGTAETAPINRMIGEAGNTLIDVTESVREMREQMPRGAKPARPTRTSAGAGPDPLPTRGGGLRPPGELPKPARFLRLARFAKVAGPVGVVATVGFAAWDARNGYNEARQNGSSILGATGAALKNALVQAVGGPEVLHVLTHPPDTSGGMACGRMGRCN